jgi:protein MpaA
MSIAVPRTRARRALMLLAGLILAGSAVPASTGLTAGPVGSATSSSADRPAVIASRVIGHSVRERQIFAYRVGQPRAETSAVVMAAMHGDEPAPIRIVRELRDGAPIVGIDLWLIPIHNRDGVVRGDRHNARGVDLNRNFPVHWKPLTGTYYSGPRPRSEPETRAVMRFLHWVDPDLVVSFHQPLHGIDVSDAKRPRWARTLARELRLPIKHIDCGGKCHGTMTQWFNKRHDGMAITVELGHDPSRRYLRTVAPRGLLRALGARTTGS